MKYLNNAEHNQPSILRPTPFELDRVAWKWGRRQNQPKSKLCFGNVRHEPVNHLVDAEHKRFTAQPGVRVVENPQTLMLVGMKCRNRIHGASVR